MKKKFTYHSLLFFVFAFLFHNSLLGIENEEHQLLFKIIENQNYCVSGFDDDKIFINPEKIIRSGDANYLDVNGFELYRLPLLQYNEYGYFLQASINYGIALAGSKKQVTKGPCPVCNVSTDASGKCRNPDCMLEGFKVL